MKLPWATGRRKRQEELNEEIAGHLRMAADERKERGEPAAQAERAARREFGNVGLVREATHEQWGWMWLEQTMQDIRYGLRMLRKAPGFAAVAVLTLALGIGANTAIFSVVYAVVLRPLPYPHPGELVRVFDANPKEGIPENGSSFLDFEDWQKENSVFSGLAGVQNHQLTLTGQGEPSVVDTAVVTPELFSVLGVNPLTGRTFVPKDGEKGAEPVVLLSENLWRERFGADPKIVGRGISLDKRLYTVVGVMPAAFRYPLLEASEEIWIPVKQDPVFGQFVPFRGGHWLRVIARLKPGVSMAQAQAEMETISARLAKSYPKEDGGWTVKLEPLQKVIVGNVRKALLVLLGAVGLVLLIACANIANLQLARATTRTKEMAVRIALGAGRKRVARQLLTESAVLGALGGVAGIFLAEWGVTGLSALLPPDLPQLHAIQIDGGVLAFALVISAIASVVFGLAPALLAARSDLLANLKEGGGRGSEGGNRRRMRGLLAATEIALAMAMLVAAGLLGRSFEALTSVNPGFDAQGVTKADVSLPQFEYSKPSQWSEFAGQLMQRLQAQPGMQETAVGIPLPLDEGFVNLGFDIVGAPPMKPGTTRDGDAVSVTPLYFRVMDIPLLRGRRFGEGDVASAPPVTVISEALAREYFPNEDPIGRKLIFPIPPDQGPEKREIVGIVGDVRDQQLNEKAGPMMYVPYAQSPYWGAQVVVKTKLSAGQVGAAIETQVHEMDKDLPVTDVRSLSAVLSNDVAQPRYRTMLLGIFGAIALALAAAGLFGVVSYSVSCRTQELGIRMALGATPGKILRMMLGESAKLTLMGLGIGFVLALGLTQFLSSLLFGVSALDPLTFAGVALILAAVVLGAAYVPTRRAMRVDPMNALRYE